MRGPQVTFVRGRGLDHRLAHQDSLRDVLGGLGQAGGLVDRIADDGVFETGVGADVAGEYQSTCDADTDIEFACGADLVADSASSAQRRGPVVVQFDRGAEDAQRRIALELVHQAAVDHCCVDDDGEQPVELVDEVAWFQPVREGCRADHIDEECGDFTHVPCEVHALIECSLGDVGPDVPTEEVAQPVAFTQALRHIVHRTFEQTDLARGSDGDGDVEIAAFDSPKRLPQAVERQCYGTRKRPGRDRSADQAHSRDVERATDPVVWRGARVGEYDDQAREREPGGECPGNRNAGEYRRTELAGRPDDLRDLRDHRTQHAVGDQVGETARGQTTHRDQRGRDRKISAGSERRK